MAKSRKRQFGKVPAVAARLAKPARTVNPAGELIRRKRIENGWSQEMLAGRAQVSLDTVKRAEKGQPIFPTKLSLLANGLGVSTPGQLLPTGDDLMLESSSTQDYYLKVDLTREMIAENAEKFLTAIMAAMEISKSVRLVRADPGGSIFITLEMPYKYTPKLRLFDTVETLKSFGVAYFIVYPPLSSTDPVYRYQLENTSGETPFPFAWTIYPLARYLPPGLKKILDASQQPSANETFELARQSADVRYVYRYIPFLWYVVQKRSRSWATPPSLKKDTHKTTAAQAVIKLAPGLFADPKAIRIVNRYLSIVLDQDTQDCINVLNDVERRFVAN